MENPNAALNDELIRWLADRPLDRKEFVIVGSAPLLAHGLESGVLRDLDVVACGATWRRVYKTGHRRTGTITGAPMASFYGGRVHFSEEWFGPHSTHELIERADIIGDLRFASLPDVLEYKRFSGRVKDQPHIQALERYLKSAGSVTRYGTNVPVPAA